VTLTKQVEYKGDVLTCGYQAEGQAATLFSRLQGYKMVDITQANNRYQISLDTQQSEFGSLSDLGLLGLKSLSEDVPTLHLTILGHQLQSNFEQGEINTNRFELSEHLMGERTHFQTEFVVSVQSSPPNLFERLTAFFNEFLLWLQAKWQELQQS
ncbi:MAG: hypothetical protein R3194_04710, partial [Limnobacter sp.]|nr:hypothetical protein [Limnobacter sp.]